MDISFGYELTYRCSQRTPMLLMLHTHPSRFADLLVVDRMVTSPVVPLHTYLDGFGNICTRLVAPADHIQITADGLIRDSGRPEPAVRQAAEIPVEDLPDDVLVYLLGSRYCETEHFMGIAWSLFGLANPGWDRVQAICDFVHMRIAFGYQHARPTKTAWEAYQEGRGVCRDFAHVAIALCRCMNIPARYCTGYLGDIGVPAADAPMDFAGWFEAYIGGQWHTFDPRNNQRRVGRILMARGRDAADVAISTTFGVNFLESFRVWTDEFVPLSAAQAGPEAGRRYG
jgi:transglutaminase-like putative cysteine protease